LVGQLIAVLIREKYNAQTWLLFDLEVKKLTLMESCSDVIDEILELQHSANILTTQNQLVLQS